MTFAKGLVAVLISAMLAGGVAAQALSTSFTGTYAGTFDFGGEQVQVRVQCSSDAACTVTTRTPATPHLNVQHRYAAAQPLGANEMVAASLRHLQQRLSKRDFEPELSPLGNALRPVVQDLREPGPTDCLDLSPQQEPRYHALCAVRPKDWSMGGVLYMPVLLADACGRSLFCGRVIFPLQRQETP